MSQQSLSINESKDSEPPENTQENANDLSVTVPRTKSLRHDKTVMVKHVLVDTASRREHRSNREREE